jgi:predicted SAM-dependent methyltransferase
MKVESTKLNIGCGYRKLNDHWNVDSESKCNPDQVMDLETTPWPYEDDSFERITAHHILEHLGQDPKVFLSILKEMYRVSSDGAEWHIAVPHHRCDIAWDDFTHVRMITAKTFKMFDQKHNYEIIERGFGESTFGIHNNMDLEVVDVNYDIVSFWKQQLDEEMLGNAELNIKLNTLSNVAETVSIFIKVHKPGRFQHLIK